MLISFKEIISAFIVLFAIIDITGSIPVFISLESQGKKISALQATGVSLGIFLAFFFAGNGLLKLFSVDIESFAVAGSIVLFILAFEMLLGVEIFKNDAKAGSSSIVPVAFPLIAGPGALTTLIALQAEYQDVNILIALILNLSLDFVVIRYLHRLEKILGSTLVFVLRKFFGVILLAIGIKLFLTNLGTMLAGLNIIK